MLTHFDAKQKNSGYSYADNDGKRNFLQTGFSLSPVCNYRFVIFIKLISLYHNIGVTANYLIYLVWRAIRMLQIAGLQVICVTADGASPNRKFFKLHKIDKLVKSGITYVAPNVCCKPGNYVYFMADVPHLIKTVRNAWYNSQLERSRHLVVSFKSYMHDCMLHLIYQNNGCDIKWSHLVELAEMSTADSGLYIGRKLTREHLVILVLTSYSRMTVRLAVQVILKPATLILML